MRNKPFIVLLLLVILVGSKIAAAADELFCDGISVVSNLNLGEDLFVCIPSSSVDSRSNESSFPRWDCS